MCYDESMRDELKPMAVAFRCLACGRLFTASQGSRQRYCPDCIAEKVKHKKPDKLKS